MRLKWPLLPLSRLLGLLCLVLGLGISTYGQGVPYSGPPIALTRGGFPAAGARVTVCAGNVPVTFNASPPCSPYQNIYSDSALTQPITQPGFVTDGLGNYPFYLPNGVLVTIVLDGPNLVGYKSTWTANGGNATGRLNVYGTALGAGNFVLTGWGSGASVTTVTGTDSAFTMSITAGTGPTVDPQVSLTWVNGPWVSIATEEATMVGGTGQTSDIVPAYPYNVSALAFTYLGLPVSGKTYNIQVVTSGVSYAATSLISPIIQAPVAAQGVIFNPGNIAQDTIITNNYDANFSYLLFNKQLTTVTTSIGFMNIFQQGGTPAVAHGSVGLYNVADFTNMNGGLGIGMNNDVYYKDFSTQNVNVLPGFAGSVSLLGSANFPSPVVGLQNVIENLGSGIVTFAADFMAPNSGNLGTGSITNMIGFAALDQRAVGTALTAGFYAASQTSCGSCWGFFSSPTNSDIMGNLTVTSLIANGGSAAMTGNFTATGTLSAASFQLNGGRPFIYGTLPSVSSGFGSGASVSNGNGTSTLRVAVGTSPGSSGVLTFPAANAGWDCSVNNLSAAAGNRADNTVQTGSTTTSVTVQNQTKSTGAAINFTANDVLIYNCSPF